MYHFRQYTNLHRKAPAMVNHTAIILQLNLGTLIWPYKSYQTEPGTNSYFRTKTVYCTMSVWLCIVCQILVPLHSILTMLLSETINVLQCSGGFTIVKTSIFGRSCYCQLA